MKSEISIKAAIYLRAAELVEMGHCKHHIAERADGLEVWPDSPEAVAWCYVGAMSKARDEIGGNVPNYHGAFADGDVINWNNNPSTTKEMVAAKLRSQAFGDGHERRRASVSKSRQHG